MRTQDELIPLCAAGSLSRRSTWKPRISPAENGIRSIRISYDLVGFIPVEELLKQETA